MKAVFELLSFLARVSGELKLYRTFFWVILTGAVSGLGGAGLVVLINGSLNSGGSSGWQLMKAFFSLLLLVAITGFTSQALVARLSARAVYELRTLLGRRLLGAPVQQLEKLGANRLYAHLTDDVQTISGSLVDLPVLCLHVFIIAGCVLYLAWLSLPIFLLVVLFLVVGVLVYRFPSIYASRHFRRVRESLDTLFQHFRGLVLGAKELKLHRERRQAFLHDAFQPTAWEIRTDMTKAMVVLAVAHWADHFLFFGMIGVFIFVLPQGNVPQVVITGYVLTFLYMKGSLQVLMGRFAMLAQALVAVRKVEELTRALEGVEPEPETAAVAKVWRHLVLKDVTHRYRREQEDDSFLLGPINLTLEPGDLLFLVGGNGSGKTTLAKILMGIYAPEGGLQLLDGEPVTGANRDAYRQLFSVVFSDFFLFDSLLGLEGPGLDERAADYLRSLHLDRKVKVEEGKLSTLDLSQGQRKRLALLTAYLEDRPIYLFDEWAADQDPEFKEVFYRQMLPELKARGKTVIVISHDDRYFDVADRIVKLEDGHLAAHPASAQLASSPVSS